MKRISAFILILAMTVSVFAIQTFAEEKKDGGVSPKHMEFLYAFGIISDAEMNKGFGEQSISRGEAAVYFCRLLQLKVAEPVTFESIFYDVTSEIPYYKYIKTIYDAGYMKGDGNGRFRPNSPISSREAARVLTDIIGYRAHTAVTGLENTILKTDIYDGTDVGDELTYGDFLRMIYNILEAPACVAVTFGDDVEFGIDKDYIGVEYLFNVAKSEGICDGSKGTRLECADELLADDRVSVNGESYVFDGDTKAFLGYSVDFFYREESGKKYIVYMEKNARNRELVLESDNITDYSAYVFEYEMSGNAKEARISEKTDIIYNGVAYPMILENEIVPSYGNVRLIDNDNDRVYDVMLIEEYEFLLAETIDKRNKRITDRDGTVLNLKEADSVSIVSDGIEYDFDRLITGHFLKIKRSREDSGYYVAEIEVLRGEKHLVPITKITSDSVVAGGDEYLLWEHMDSGSKDNLKVGATVTAYVCDGMLMRVTVENKADYGYIVNVANRGNELTSELVFKIVLNNAEPVEIPGADVVKIDGIRYTLVDEMRNALAAGATLSAGYNSSYPYAQPVKYTLNGKGLINSIDTMYFNSEEENSETSLRRLSVGDRLLFRSSGNTLYDGNEFVAYLPENSVFNAPKSDRAADSDYRLRTLSDTGTYIMDVMNVDEESCACERVFVYIEPYPNGTSSPYVVIDKTKELGEDDEVLSVLTIGNGSREYTYSCVERALSVYDGLNVGDVIRIELNREGNIRAITKEYGLYEIPDAENRVKISQVSYNSTKLPPYADGDRFVYGTVLNFESGFLKITPSLISDPGGIDEDYRVDVLMPGEAAVWKYTQSARLGTKVEKGSLSDIVAYSENKEEPSSVLVEIRGSGVFQIFVIETVD